MSCFVPLDLALMFPLDFCCFCSDVDDDDGDDVIDGDDGDDDDDDDDVDGNSMVIFFSFNKRPEDFPLLLFST